MSKNRERITKGVESIANALFMIKYAYRLYPYSVLVKIPIIIFGVAIKLLPLLFVREILNRIQNGFAPISVFRVVVAYGGSLFLIKVLLELFKQLSGCIESKTRRITSNDISKRITKLPYYEVEKPETRTFLQMIDDNMDVSDLISSISSIIMQVLVLGGLVSIICTLQPTLIALIIIVLIIKTIVNGKGRKLWNDWRVPINNEMRKVRYLFRILSDSSYGKDIRVNGLQRWMSEKMSTAEDGYIAIMSKYNRKLQLKNVFVEVALVIQELIVYLLLAYRVFFGGLLIGDYSMYVSSISSFTSALSTIIDNGSNILKSGDYFALYKEILGKEDEGETGHIPDITQGVNIKFDHVSFAYPGSDKMILNDFSLEIKNGESLSIVGMNGAGKTTFVKLLCRFYKPSRGTIYLNGIDIFSFAPEEYKKVLGVVFQDFKLFGFSVAENISLTSNGSRKKNICRARKMWFGPKSEDA